MTLFHEYFEQNASAFPNKRAVCANGSSATYGELARMAELFTRALREAGANVGDRVALCSDLSAESLAAALGIFSAGCILVPISHLSDSLQLFDQLEDCGAVVLVTNIRVNIQAIATKTAVREVIPISHGGTAIGDRFNCADELSSVYRPRSCSEGLNEKSMAAIFYSSGSTARAKGVLVSHQNMIAAFVSVTSYLENTPDDVVLSFTAGLSSDYGFYNTMMPLLFGGTAVVQTSLPSTADAILALIHREGVTGLQVFPPAILRLVEDNESGFANMSSLRYISSSGGVLPRKHITRLRNELPSLKIFSNYGMTECKRIAFLAPDEIDGRAGSVGKAIPGIQTYLVDKNGELLTAPNTTGELIVAGDLLMQGYWNRPELTASVVKQDFAGHKRIFFTGDMFRMDDHGFLYFVCRKSDLFYRNSLPINPSEVEQTILEHEAVSEVAVVPIPESSSGHLPRACVVLKRGKHISEDELLQYCAGRLSPHCIPAEVTFHDSLPRTFGGKASRAGLDSAISNA